MQSGFGRRPQPVAFTNQGRPTETRENLRPKSLITPAYFELDLSDTESTFYSGLDQFSLLIRRITIANDTGASIETAINAGGSLIYIDTISDGMTVAAEASEGLLIKPSEDLSAYNDVATSGSRLIGWGLKIQGGDTWTL
jgi:hypothetical protein